MPAQIIGRHAGGFSNGPVPQRIELDDPFLLLPGTTMVRGTNLVPHPDNVGRWDLHWGTNWDWTDWVKPQIDAAAAVGANVIRVMMSTSVTYFSYATLSTLLSRIDQIIDYAATLGIYTYLCPSDNWHDLNGTNTDGVVPMQNIEDQIVAVAAHIHDTGRWEQVFAMDLMNEGADPWGQEAEGLAAVTAVREVTNLLLTCSTFAGPGIGEGHLTDNTLQGRIADRFDFIDWHWYVTPSSSSFVQTYHWDHRPTTPIVFGEFGANQGMTSGDRIARYNGVKALVDAVGGSGQRVAGAMQWAITDQDTAASNQWGMYDVSFVERTELTGIFASFPTSTA